MKKSQKRQKRLVLVAMVLMIGLVAGMGAMTYSKYITTATAPAENATAAKWNYTLSATATDLFSSDYAGTTLAIPKPAGNGVAVRANASAKVVAPGTTGSMSVTISGYSEVLAQFKMSMECTEIKCGDYVPIKWTLKKGEDVIQDKVNLATFLAALEGQTAKAAWNAGTNYYQFSTTYTIIWEWALSDGNNDAEKTYSMYDTLIGYKVAGATWDTVKVIKGATGATFEAFATENGINYADPSNIVTSIVLNFSATIEQIQA